MCACSAVRAENPAYDYLIKNASVYDGLSVLEKKSVIAIKGDAITVLGGGEEPAARQVIDAEGLVLAPGFIDAHTHSDFNPLVYPDLPNKVMQGVTTEVTGNCGMSAAPVLNAHEGEVHQVWAREGVAIPEQLAWGTFERYAAAMRRAGLLTNHVSLIGHGNLRGAVMGFEARKPTPGELKAMKKILAQAMEEGAAGLSFGLVYLPGIYADSEEIAALCEEVRKHNGVCAFHIRSEGSQLVESIQEALEAGKSSGARIQISHLKAGGKKNWHKMEEVFDLIGRYREQGVKVMADVYPYTAGYAELAGALPPFYYEMEKRTAFFKNAGNHAEIETKIRGYYADQPDRWKEIAVGAIPGGKFSDYEGKTIGAIAAKTKRSPERVLIELLAETNFEVSAFYFSQSEDIVDRVVLAPFVSVGSDSIADGSSYPHPRAFGTFPKIVRQYVRDEKSLVLGRAIRKMTSEPARQFGLENRGEIRTGFKADLVIFDPKTIRDRSDYEKPSLESEGIRWVFVNGTPVVREGKFTGRKKGRFLN